jgi:hypothetical protein
LILPVGFIKRDGDHFQQILAWTLKSRWPQPRTLSGLREITGTFRSEK